MAEQSSLEERIALLTSLRADPPDDADVPELTGQLGGAYLELYERDGTTQAIDMAIETFHTALATAPGHADVTYWYYGLGLGYMHRAAHSGNIADHDRAVGWLSLLHSDLPDADPDRDLAAVLLMEAHWDRFLAIRYGGHCDATNALNEAQRVVSAIGGLSVAHGDVELVAYGRLLLGLAHLARFDESGDRADLAAGIDRLTAVLDTLSPDTPRYAFAGGWLIDAYRQRAELDDDPPSLDLSIATGERVLGRCVPDDSDWHMLNGFQAMGYQARWRRTENPADLDRAIELWRIVLEPDSDPWPAAHCGELLRQRADLLDDATDLPEAIRLLDLAARSAAVDDPNGWLRWLELGQAYHAQWRLTQEPGSLTAAASSLDRSLQLETMDGNATLLVHNQRVLVSFDALKYQGSRPHTEPPPAAARMRHCLDEARTALHHVGSALPDLRTMLAVLLGYGEMYLAAYEMKDIDLDRIRDLIGQAARLSAPPPGWQEMSDAAHGMLQYAENAMHPGPGSDGGVRELVRVAVLEQVGEVTDMARRVLPIALQARAMWTGDIRGTRAAGSMMRRISSGGVEWVRPDPADREFDVWAGLFSAVELGQQGNFAAVVETTQRALAALDRMPSSLQNERAVRPVLHYLRTAALAATGRPVAVEPLAESLPGDVLTDQALGELILAAGAQLSTAIAGTDLGAIRHCTARLAELAGRARAGHATRLMAVGLAGVGELETARRDPADTAAAARSAVCYEELAAASGPDHPLWTRIALSLAESLRRARHGERARTRQLGMSALRGHGWRVLLQSGTDHAIESARAASADAYKVAGWCLEDRAYDEAVAVLDAGRGLVLHSATTSQKVADLLSRAGCDELAAEWRDSAGFGRNQLTGTALTAAAEIMEVPDDLRLRVLRALGVDGPESLLTPTTAAKVRRALAAVGADALVYLVPASGGCPGTAVVVPASGSVDAIALPSLQTGAGSPLAEYVQTDRRRRDIHPPGVPDGGQPNRRLDKLCRWAWSAAMRALVGYIGRWCLPRPARLVLIPMGSLALVPWHAAYVDTGRGRRYAVQDIVFSYSVSARMFCMAAAHPVQRTRSALIVGDPRSDLPFAGIEAQAIRSRFYPNGRYLGRPQAEAAGPGTPEEVLDWVASATPGPSTLHFACHGSVDTSRPADAHLVLAGGTLAARRLLEASRLAALEVDRVFLAACTTNVTGADYDEAFSLATAFHAAGAHTVFGSLWSVPDEDTSVLMYLVHHNLNVGSCTPVDALHQAQLWMLDPARAAPDGMPPLLRLSFNQPHRADPVSWAAFTHIGR